MEEIKEYQKIKIDQNLKHYREVLSFLGADAPIQVLTLPKRIENVLIKNELFRLYDLIRVDLREIKGLGNAGITLLCSRLDEFFPMQM